MAHAIRMPDFGTAVDEIRLVKWLVEEGAAVARGDLLAELETDKATTELESAAAGFLLRRCVPGGAMVEAGQIIAYVGDAGETPPEAAPDPAHHPAAAVAAAPPPPPTPRVAPVVANLAARTGVDLASLRGTGAGGMITRQDVLDAAHRRQAPVEPAPGLSRTQTAVARAVEQSNTEIPQLRLAATFDMSAVEGLRQRLEAGRRRRFFDAVFVKAMARALAVTPLLAARLEERRIVTPAGIHISLAVSSGNELLLPVVRDPGEKQLGELQTEIEALAGRAARGELEIQHTTGGVMTLSNLGMYPVDWFEALVFPGQTAVLALGAVSVRPCVAGGRLEARPMVTVTLAADHRLVNGRTAAEFLRALKEIVETASLA